MAVAAQIHKEFNEISKKQISLLAHLRDNEMGESICQQLQHTPLTIYVKITEDARKGISLNKINIELISHKHLINVKIDGEHTEIDMPEVYCKLHITTINDITNKNTHISEESSYLLIGSKEDERLMNDLNLLKPNIHFMGVLSEDSQLIDLASILESPRILKVIYAKKEEHIHKLTKVAYKILRRRSNILSGNVILNKGKEILLLGNNVKNIQIESNKIKQEFTKEIRSELVSIENKVEEIFSDSSPEIQEQLEHIQQYEGHNEDINGKIATYSFPEGYLDTLKLQSKETVVKLFNKLNSSLDAKTELIEKKIQSIQSEKYKITLCEFSIDDENFLKGVDRDLDLLKPEIRKAGYSGMSAIFGAIRTPIYALFPLMMIARFIPSSDVGAIDHSIKSYDNQSVVAVSEIPETYSKSITKFIDAVNSAVSNGELINKRTGKDMFKFSMDSRGKKSVEYSTLKRGDKMPYILLPVYSDREDAAKILMDNILTIQLRFNIVAEVKKIPKILGPFERFFGPIVLCLLFYFIYAKKNSMKQTNEGTRKNECAELTKNMTNGFNLFLKSSETNFNQYLKSYIRKYTEEKTKIIDDYFMELINNEEAQRIKDIKLFKSREKLFQTELKNITDTHRKLFEVGKEYSSVIQKISK